MVIQSKKPVWEQKKDNVSITVWENSRSDGKTYMSIYIKKNYLDQFGHWRSANTFDMQDIDPLL